jgi:hydroxypyruvate isomerase
MSHTLRYAVNCSILLTGLPRRERPAAARASGFDGVEFWWPFDSAVPADAEVDAFVSSVQEAGVQLVGLNFAAGDMPGGDRGLVSWPARSAELRDNLDVVADIGERLGCRAFNALYGNRVDGESAQAQDDLAVENLALAAAAVGRIGGTVLIEPVSGADRYPIRTAAQATAVIDRVAREGGASNVRLLADLYHLAVNGDDVPAVIAGDARLIGHVQVADAPGRGEPGTGELPLDGWLSDLQQAGYSGWVGLEYRSEATDPFAWLPRERRGSAARTA